MHDAFNNLNYIISRYLTVLIVLFINIILKSVRQHNHVITQGNYKATCFDYRLVILRPILSIVSQDATHTLKTHKNYVNCFT